MIPCYDVKVLERLLGNPRPADMALLLGVNRSTVDDYRRRRWLSYIVAMVARALGRFGISLDLSADYNRLARWRIWSSQHGEKAAQRTHKENQGDLFHSPESRATEDVVGL